MDKEGEKKKEKNSVIGVSRSGTTLSAKSRIRDIERRKVLNVVCMRISGVLPSQVHRLMSAIVPETGHSFRLGVPAHRACVGVVSDVRR